MYKELEKIISDKSKVMYEEIMAPYTSFKIGGAADCFIIAETKSDFIQIMKYIKENGLPYFIVGKGSNLLVSDRGIRGVVIKLGGEFREVYCDGEFITAGSAYGVNSLAQIALENSLTGFEWAFGIPGSVGGAVFMNAGAYGGNMADVLYSTRYLDEDFNECVLDNEGHNFGYRKSAFKTDEIKGIILDTTLKLNSGKKEDIWADMKKYMNARLEKQPLNMPSAGSVFKRPDGHFVGKLVEDLGLKGFSIGGAMVSSKHGGFIVNTGGATASDVKQLITYIKDKVKENYDVDLETEILEVGE